MNCAISTTTWRYDANDPSLARYRAAGLDFDPVDDNGWALKKPCVLEFTTVAELCDWAKAIGQDIILGADGAIEIYDTYRE